MQFVEHSWYDSCHVTRLDHKGVTHKAKPHYFARLASQYLSIHKRTYKTPKMSRTFTAEEVTRIQADYQARTGRIPLVDKFPYRPLPDDRVYLLGAYMDVVNYRIQPRHLQIHTCRRNEIEDLEKIHDHLLFLGLLHPLDAWTDDSTNTWGPQLFTFFEVIAPGTPPEGRWMCNWLHQMCWKEVLKKSHYVYVVYNKRPTMSREEGQPEDYILGLCALPYPWWPERWLGTETEWPGSDGEDGARNDGPWGRQGSIPPLERLHDFGMPDNNSDDGESPVPKVMKKGSALEEFLNGAHIEIRQEGKIVAAGASRMSALQQNQNDNTRGIVPLEEFLKLDDNAPED
ncbi:hypothetical protein EDC01DRAFT_732012 [Geopyxis carbonaria]|nr:hypothetical protein EDC01DRAFT_732012 [Geopyxis carbonaria]